MELTHLRYFVNVAKTRSFVHGARLSHVSPPAMSKAIKKLERELGTELFTRTTRSAALTESGEILLAHCRSVFRSIDNLYRTLEEAQAKICGDLRIGAAELFSIELLPSSLCQLASEYPHLLPLTFDASRDVMEHRLIEGELDIAFAVGESTARAIESTPIGQSARYLVCGQSHPLHERGTITPKELESFSFVVTQGDGFPEERFSRQIGAGSETLPMAIHMAATGRYLGYFPEVAIRRQLRDGTLRRLNGVKLGGSFELCALAARGLKLKPGVPLLIEAVKKQLASG